MYVVLALLLQAAPSAPQPDLTEIVRKMYERVDHDAGHQIRGATWQKNKIEEDITDPKQTKVEHRETYRVWGDGDRMMQQKTLRDGKQSDEKPKPLSFFVDRTFLDRFEFSLAEPVRVQCGQRVCWYLSFVPKPGQDPDGLTDDVSLEQKFISGATGTVQVDVEHFGIVNVDVHTTQPHESFVVDVYWFQATVTQTEFHGVMVSTYIEMSYAYDTLIGHPKAKRSTYTSTEVKFPPSR